MTSSHTRAACPRVGRPRSERGTARTPPGDRGRQAVRRHASETGERQVQVVIGFTSETAYLGRMRAPHASVRRMGDGRAPAERARAIGLEGGEARRPWQLDNAVRGLTVKALRSFRLWLCQRRQRAAEPFVSFYGHGFQFGVVTDDAKRSEGCHRGDGAFPWRGLVHDHVARQQ